MNLRTFIALTGTTLIVIGCFTAFCWDAVVDYIMEKELKLDPRSTSFEAWRNPSAGALRIYFFNWTNPQSNFTADYKPHFVEIGPYSFTESIRKVNATFHNNKTISYFREHIWHFDRENSVGNLEDKITSLDPVAMSTAYITRFNSYLMRFSVSGAMRVAQQKIYLTTTVGEILFSGYTDPLMTIAGKLPSFMAAPIAFDKFGWFYKRNVSAIYDGAFNIETGEDDIRKLGKIHKWNYRNRTDAFSAECGMVNGTDGTFFGPRRTREKPLQIFFQELCRTIQFDYIDDQEVNGIHGYRYKVAKSNVDNGSVDPNKKCFCTGECVPYGAFNISNCHYGTPIFVSYPHFLNADPSYFDHVEGLNPNEAKHSSYITIEPTAGVALAVNVRIQMNMLLQPYDDIRIYNNVPKMVFPVLWLEEAYSAQTKYTYKLKLLLAVPVIGICFSIGLVLLGLILITMAFVHWRRHKKSRTDQTEENEREKNILIPQTIALEIAKKEQLNLNSSKEDHPESTVK